ncbi:hypothetical protein, partial [Pseudomonas fluorescens]|uniref:hypothetical protein n=1 Tax=Pseudomonas fluorescens TaxID=294 RepID=UPI001A92B03E
DFLVTFVWAGIPVFTKVTRCKSGTLLSRDRSNGYVPRPISLKATSTLTLYRYPCCNAAISVHQW